ncbi:hypothetical protein FS837_012860 [Tulasnella sp. UAMH 9824]|nr:hypothetical protein FS837_012860 [Tulasnella sp. UAMH 9824]
MPFLGGRVMKTTARNHLSAQAVEVPDPVEDFGQDGGKFYRCYDTLAEEVDDDMVNGLKEQLDGMLIFAGLFAGINSAFLALTLPLLSADLADDISALLAQNNAILVQMATGRNDSIPASPQLPSADFSPSPNIFAVNALFSLSLAFAIISSFLAVLGRQWLVYYRKRSGGGPDSQRWEQLKRFLGAGRWRLEPILDDVLPSLLQIGLIIFCTSLILYLRHLSPTISLIVAVPMYIALAFFIGSALCTVWDKFCPFQSPLSHVLFWSARTIPSVMRGIKAPRWDQLSKGVSLKRWANTLTNGRKEDSPESLQVVAIQRAVCTSDDPATLLNATANLFGIKDLAYMERLWKDPNFQERFHDQWQNSYSRMLQLQGHDGLISAASSRQLYSAAAAHILLCKNHNGAHLSSLEHSISTLQELSIPDLDSKVTDSSGCLIRGTLAFTILQFEKRQPSPEAVTTFSNYLVASLLNRELRDWGTLCVIAFIIANVPDLQGISPDSREALSRAYRGENTPETLVKDMRLLIAPDSTHLPNRAPIVINALHWIDRMLCADNTQAKFTIEQKFSLLEVCERVLPSPRFPGAARDVARQIRVRVSDIWQQEFAATAKTSIPKHLFCVLEQHITKISAFHLAKRSFHQSVEVLQIFGPSTRQLLSYGYNVLDDEAKEAHAALIETFNKKPLGECKTRMNAGVTGRSEQYQFG